MNAFVNRIDLKLKEKNIKRVSLCADLNISSTSITDWNRRNTIPNGDICLKIANYLNVSVEWLITGEDNTLSNELRKILNMYTLLDTSQKETVYTLIETLLNKKG